MHHLLLVRGWFSWRILYITGSRILTLGELISILARRTLAPSANSPALILVNKSKFSSIDRLRQELSFPISVKVPLYSRVCSEVKSHTYAFPFLISSQAY